MSSFSAFASKRYKKIGEKMPIGVPKVPFRLPGEEDAVWVDI